MSLAYYNWQHTSDLRYRAEMAEEITRTRTQRLTYLQEEHVETQARLQRQEELLVGL